MVEYYKYPDNDWNPSESVSRHFGVIISLTLHTGKYLYSVQTSETQLLTSPPPKVPMTYPFQSQSTSDLTNSLLICVGMYVYSITCPLKVSVHLRQSSHSGHQITSRGSTRKWIRSWKPSRIKVQTCHGDNSDKKWCQVDIPTYSSQSHIFRHCWKTFLCLSELCIYLSLKILSKWVIIIKENGLMMKWQI